MTGKKHFKIMVVDDEPRAVAGLVEVLKLDGYDVVGFSLPPEALSYLQNHQVDLLLTDLKMPEVDGLELLGRARILDEKLSVIMITGQGTVGDAVTAMKAGADDYLVKPINFEELEIIITRLREKRDLQAQNEALKAINCRQLPAHDFIGRSPAMAKIFAAIREVAPTTAGVLIEGETGTGKELVARSLHRYSRRADKPLITINCAALHEGLLESELFGHVKGAFTGALRNKQGKFALADGGTIFLDEIGDMALSVQAKLLRVLVSGEFQQVGGEKTYYADVRVLAATNKDLKTAVADGDFREDLYYRLNVVQFQLPSLRERRGDIPLLVDYFCRRVAAREGRVPVFPDAEALHCLEQADWPGNVRELENVIERALIYAKDRPIRMTDLPEHLCKPRIQTMPADEAGDWCRLTIKEMEKQMIEAALQRCPSKVQAARELGISVRKIEYRLKEWASESRDQ